MRKQFRYASCLVAISLLAGCTYDGGGDNPIVSKFSWFSYLNGDDIRTACPGLGADRYRFVYNGIYQEQTRTYDVSFLSRNMHVKVKGAPNLLTLDTSNLLKPWQGEVRDVALSRDELDQIKKSLHQSGALKGSPSGTRVYSDEFYWTVAACVEGEFHFSLYDWPSDRWESMSFDDVLVGLDQTGVALNMPRRVGPGELWGDKPQNTGRFMIEAGKNGLVGFTGG